MFKADPVFLAGCGLISLLLLLTPQPHQPRQARREAERSRAEDAARRQRRVFSFHFQSSSS